MSVSEENHTRSTLGAGTGKDGPKKVSAVEASEELEPTKVDRNGGSNVQESPELEMGRQSVNKNTHDLHNEPGALKEIPEEAQEVQVEGENETTQNEQDADPPKAVDFEPPPPSQGSISKKGKRSEAMHRGSQKDTGHQKRASHCTHTRKKKIGATQHRMPREEYEQMFYLVPRGVLLQYGPYTFHGVTDFRLERVEGLMKILQKVGATVTLVASTDHVDRVNVWYMDHVIFSCKVTDLNHGGDGETDRLCLDAARAFDRLSRKAIHGLRNRITLQNQLESKAKNPTPAEQPAAYERL